MALYFSSMGYNKYSIAVQDQPNLFDWSARFDWM